MKKICKKCGSQKTFFPSGQMQCKKCMSEYKAEKRKRDKEAIVEYKPKVCVDCGFKEASAAVDYHHIEEKTFGIATKKVYSLEKIKKELDKCIALCANCHRKRHANEVYGKLLPCSNHEINRSSCPACFSIRQSWRRAKYKSALVAAFENKCAKCLNSFPSFVYDFHHMNPSNKAHHPSDVVMSLNITAISEEIAKCILLCSNCHREVENTRKPEFCGRTLDKETLFNILTRAKEEVSYEIKSIKNNKNPNAEKLSTLKKEVHFRSKLAKEKPKKKCKCGKQMDFRAAVCKECLSYDSKIEWPSEEAILTLLKDNSYVKVGDLLGVSDNAVRKHLKKKGIKPPKARDTLSIEKMLRDFS